MKNFDKVQKGDIAIVLEEKDAKIEIVDKCRCNNNGFEKMMERNPGIIFESGCVNHPKKIHCDLFKSGNEYQLANLEIVLCKNKYKKHVLYELKF